MYAYPPLNFLYQMTKTYQAIVQSNVTQEKDTTEEVLERVTSASEHAKYLRAVRICAVSAEDIRI